MSVQLIQTWTDDQVSKFARAQTHAALWSVEEDLRRDGVTGEVADWAARLHPSARDWLDGAARRFADEHGRDLAAWLPPDHAGYLLWMNRSGEGVGFWAQYLPTGPADELTAYAVSVRKDPARVAEFDAAMTRLADAARELPAYTLYLAQDDTIRLI